METFAQKTLPSPILYNVKSRKKSQKLYRLHCIKVSLRYAPKTYKNNILQQQNSETFKDRIYKKVYCVHRFTVKYTIKT